LKIWHYAGDFDHELGQDHAKSLPENAIMTIGEYDCYLKDPERTIYRLAGVKQIPAYKVGGGWRLSKNDIDFWIGEQSFEGHRSSAEKD